MEKFGTKWAAKTSLQVVQNSKEKIQIKKLIFVLKTMEILYIRAYLSWKKFKNLLSKKPNFSA